MSFASDTDTNHGGAVEPISQSSSSVALQKVFIADDHEEMLRIIELVLSKYFQVAGVAGDGQGVLDRAPGLCPDVIVLDICMPLMNGIEAAIRLQASGSKIKFVFLTAQRDPDFLEAAMSAGGSGYVLKPYLCSDLVPAIWAVLNGNSFISPSIRRP